MVTHPDARQKGVLEKIVRRAMQAYGFLSNFSTDALIELETVQQANRLAEPPGIDLRHLLWVSMSVIWPGWLERRRAENEERGKYN